MSKVLLAVLVIVSFIVLLGLNQEAHAQEFNLVPELAIPKFGFVSIDTHTGIGKIDLATGQLVNSPSPSECANTGPGIDNPIDLICNYMGWEAHFDIFDNEGHQLSRIKAILQEHGFDVDSEGALFFADGNDGFIVKSSNTGEFLGKWRGDPNPEISLSFRDMTINSQDNLYVTESDSDQVMVFTRSGTLINSWGSEGIGEGQFMNPRGIVVDTNDNVYVVDAGNARIQKFDLDGNFITQWSTSGIRAIAYDPIKDRIWLSSGNKVQYFSTDGVFVGENVFGENDVPRGIGISTSGFVVIAITEQFADNARLVIASNEGDLLTTFGSSGTGLGEFSSAGKVVVDDTNNVLYVSDRAADRVVKYSTGGLPCEIRVNQGLERTVQIIDLGALALAGVIDGLPGDHLSIPFEIEDVYGTCLGKDVNVELQLRDAEGFARDPGLPPENTEFGNIFEKFVFEDSHDITTTDTLNGFIANNVILDIRSDSVQSTGEVLFMITAEIDEEGGDIARSFFKLRMLGFILGLEEIGPRGIILIANQDLDGALPLILPDVEVPGVFPVFSFPMAVIVEKFCCEDLEDQGPEIINVNVVPQAGFPDGIAIMLDDTDSAFECTGFNCSTTIGNASPDFFLSSELELFLGVDPKVPNGIYEISVEATSEKTNIMEVSVIEIRRLPNTIMGPDVFVVNDINKKGIEKMQITFDNVNVAGDTLVEFSSEGPLLPSGFKLQKFEGEETFFDITTSAAINGDITISMKWKGNFPPEVEEEFKIMHFNEALVEWEDITTNVNPISNTITGVASSLSTFAILSPLDVDGGQVIGGEIIPIETTSLLLANTQTFSWMIPVLLSGIGIGMVVAKRRQFRS